MSVLLLSFKDAFTWNQEETSSFPGKHNEENRLRELDIRMRNSQQ